MRSVEFHPEAEDEFIAVAQFYESQTEGLGVDFISTVQRAYERLLEFPASGRPFGRRLRRLLVPKCLSWRRTHWRAVPTPRDVRRIG